MSQLCPRVSCCHWELGVIYCQLLGNICLTGMTADIQKMAILGPDVEGDELTGDCLPHVGLLDLVQFHSTCTSCCPGEFGM